MQKNLKSTNASTQISTHFGLVFMAFILVMPEAIPAPETILRRREQVVEASDGWQSRTIDGQPYTRYFRELEDSPEISYFVAKPESAGPFPLVVFVQGSGFDSLFCRTDNRITPQYGHASVFDIFGKSAFVMTVEKPGVPFLYDSRIKENAFGPDEFHKHFSLNVWCETIQSCLKHFGETNRFDSKRVLLIGHSEGGVVVSRLANLLQDKVSHVAVLAGEGPSQLFSLIELTRSGDLLAEVSSEPEERVKYVLSEWKKIVANPKETSETFYGFTYLRWHSFLSTSPSEELENATAKVYIAQGLNDRAVSPASARMLYAHLLSKGKDVQIDLVKDADHSFAKHQSDFEGWTAQLDKVSRWFDLLERS